MKGLATQVKGGCARPVFTPSNFALIFMACAHSMPSTMAKF
jgi:hypothetical protein